MVFPKKNSFGQIGHFWPENDVCSQLRIKAKIFFFEFSAMKGANRYIKIILMVFLKRFLFTPMGYGGPEYEAFS